MKELIRGIVALVGSLIVFSTVIVIGILYSPFHSIILAVQKRNISYFFIVWYKLLDGTLATVGGMLYNLAVDYDCLGNVWGEWVEDAITPDDNTHFGEKNTTISASIGQLEKRESIIYTRGVTLSKVLNKVFRQKRHAEGSWDYKLAKEKIDKADYHQSIKK